MGDVLLFSEKNSLDFEDVRQGVIRIPEVAVKLDEAQDIWDTKLAGDMHFRQLLCSDDETYFSNPAARALVLSVVQYGLYERFVKRLGHPEFLVGNLKGDSVLRTCVGERTFSEMITLSEAYKEASDEKEKSMAEMAMAPVEKKKSSKTPTAFTTANSGLPTGGLPGLVGGLSGGLVLQGKQLPIYHAYRGEPQYQMDDAGNAGIILKWSACVSPSGSCEAILDKLIHEYGATRVVSVGPGNSDSYVHFLQKKSKEQFQSIESIDADPMLSWFWSNMRGRQGALNFAQ